MQYKTCLSLFLVLAIGLALPSATAAATAGKSKDYCTAYAKKMTDKKMGPKYVENAAVYGATGGLSGKTAGKKQTFTGFGLSGAALGILVANGKWQKVHKQFYTRCMART